MELNEEVRVYVNQLIETEQTRWKQEQLVPLIAERDELLKHKPQETTEEQKKIKQLETDLLQQKVLSAFREADLEDFYGLVEINEETQLNEAIIKLQKLVSERKLSTGFQPDSRRQSNDPYSSAKAKGDSVGMLKSIFGIKN